MTPVSGLIAHIRTHNCTHLAGLMRCPGHRRDEVCSQHSNGQRRSLFTRWVAPTPTHTRHALIHVHIQSCVHVWDMGCTWRPADAPMEDSAGEAPVERMRMFSITAQCPGPASIIRQYYALSGRSNMHIAASHQHTLSGPPPTIPPAWHYLATRPLTKYSFLTVCTYVSLYIKSTQFNPHTLYPHSCVSISSHPVRLPLSLKRLSRRRFIITALFRLKAPTSIFTFKTLW